MIEPTIWRKILDHFSLSKGVSHKGRMGFNKLVSLVLDADLHKHEQFLASFVNKFKKLDDNSDGVLNSDQTFKLLKNL